MLACFFFLIKNCIKMKKNIIFWASDITPLEVQVKNFFLIFGTSLIDFFYEIRDVTDTGEEKIKQQGLTYTSFCEYLIQKNIKL